MSKTLRKESTRISIDLASPNEPASFRHCLPSFSNAAGDFVPDPVLSSYADPEVLAGKKSGPAVSPSVVENCPTICIICGVDFNTRSQLHAHLSDHTHLSGKVDKYKEVPLYECKQCVAEVNCTNILRHRCFMKRSAQISEVESLLDSVGSPLACIFCRGRILPSRAHLAAHLIFAHSPHRNPLKCVFCNAKFQSDNLYMQETHAFTHHVPELIFLNRIGYFKMIKTPSGLTVEVKVPFLCLYDPSKTESSSWLDAITVDARDSGVLSEKSKKSENIGRTPVEDLCCKAFKDLAEYTAHIYCRHTILPHSRDKGRDFNASEVRQLDAIKRGLPGPTIRELLKASVLGPFGRSKTLQMNPSNKSAVGERKSVLLRSGWNRKTTVARNTCRVCLHDYRNEDRLVKHIEDFHVPEMRKRVQHLADVGDLVGLLDIDRLCTECFTLFPSAYKLQVHMLVAHAGQSWFNCGICDQQFCEPNHCLPAFMTAGPVMVTTEDDNQSKWEFREEVARTSPEPPSVEKNPSFAEDLDALYAPYESKLSTLTICRVLDCHEARHCATLQPPLKFPHLPMALITQLLESRGYQGKQIFDWLSATFDQPPLMDVKPFVFEDPDAKKGGKTKTHMRLNPGEEPLSQEGVDMGHRLLEALVARRAGLLQAGNSDYEEEAPALAAERSLSEATRDTPTTSLPTPARGNTSVEAAAAGQKSSLPQKLVKLFTHIGERNVVVQQEKEFIERV